MGRLFLSGQTTCALLLGAGLLLRAQGAFRSPEHAAMDSAKTRPAEMAGERAAAAGRFCSGFFGFGCAAAMALRCSACSSSQMVIGLAMYQVEYVPEMMPTSMAAAKSQMVPTP